MEKLLCDDGANTQVLMGQLNVRNASNGLLGALLSGEGWIFAVRTGEYMD